MQDRNDKVEQKLVPGIVGMAAKTNAIYYVEMHQAAGRVLSSPISFRSVMVTPDFSILIQAAKSGDTAAASESIVQGAKDAAAAGADFIVIGSNTGSTFADAVAAQSGLPVLGIAETVIATAREKNFRRIGLVSTRQTARSRMYQALGAASSIEFFPPSPALADAVDSLIFQELAQGKTSAAGHQLVLDVIEWFRSQEADAVVLACTDLTLLTMDPASTALPLLDSTLLHARAAAALAVQGRQQS
ncbi:aspartate racemase [Polaromonas sp. OV174]|uniref:aspartate/glutamate racemase family protein n=1 Tax=Polaromonas sp. OV174 TaxID=1855300 RepID=UPI0008E74243|nr:aspartate/glutamate racemase family protein [Polaromonas sp. OV174]SFC74631.1 aspartate racemase [Polaromonas sp. OV174]